MASPSAVEQRLAEVGLDLPDLVPPLAAYTPAVTTGSLVFTAGQLPLRAGELLAEGVVGHGVTPDEAAMCAQQCALNAIAAVKAEIEDLDLVTRVVKVVVFVASSPGFFQQAAVADGASQLLATAFGEAGRHARSAVGVAVLPLNAPVEVEIVVAVG